MVIKTKSMFGIQDIETMEITCSKCGATIVLPFSDAREFPDQCQNCKGNLTGGEMDPIHKKFSDLMGAIRWFQKEQGDGKFSLNFSLKEQK